MKLRSFKILIVTLFISFILSSIAVLAINHNGRFTYKADTSELPQYDDEGNFLWEFEIPWETPVLSVNYTSYFGSEVFVERPGYKVQELEFTSNSDFYSYPNIIKYYINGTIKDYWVILIFATVIFLIILLIRSIYISKLEKFKAKFLLINFN